VFRRSPQDCSTRGWPTHEMNVIRAGINQEFAHLTPPLNHQEKIFR
jgi:hypothetical protein